MKNEDGTINIKLTPKEVDEIVEALKTLHLEMNERYSNEQRQMHLNIRKLLVRQKLEQQ